MSKTTISRRTFLTMAGTAACMAGVSRQAHAARVGPNDKVRLGLIGCGNMGTRHLEALSTNPQCEVVAVCDVEIARYEGAMNKAEGWGAKRPEGYQDFRHVLDRQDVDAIFVVTPDHWHPLLTILGCQAGKDVYVEKPVCPTVAEGRAMVQAARRYGRVVQVGTQQRSTPLFLQAMEIIHSGRLGQITAAGAWVGVNSWEVGETIEPAPEGLDWDMWLGPAPWVPYSKQRHRGFMGWHDYCRGGQLTNWGVHLIDIVHWGIGEDRPLSVQAIGGSYRGGGGADNYETIEAIFEYKGCNVTWEQRHKNQRANKQYGMQFFGTEGWLAMDRNTIVVWPDELGIGEIVGEPERSWASPEHHNNFFDCVRTRRRPAADIEQGFRSTAAVLLAGIALKTGRKLYWDGDAERFVNDTDADRYLARPYRAPWHL